MLEGKQDIRVEGVVHEVQSKSFTASFALILPLLAIKAIGISSYK
jgi:hypothetical protein